QSQAKEITEFYYLLDFVQTLNNPIMKSFFFLFICSFFISSVSNSIVSRTITGNIINDQGDPVAAIVQAGNIRALADAEGNYTIKISSESILEFSANGYETKNINIGKQDVYNIVMKPDRKKTEELVFTKNNIAKQQVAAVDMIRIHG